MHRSSCINLGDKCTQSCHLGMQIVGFMEICGAVTRNLRPFTSPNDNFHYSYSYSNVLFLTSENEISGLIYSLFRGRQNIFLPIVRSKVVKCAANILKVGLTNISYIQK